MSTKFITTATLLAFLFASTFSSCEKDQADLIEKSEPDAYPINFTPAKTSNELIALRKDAGANLIRTMAQFDAAVASKVTPLSKLSKADLAEFRNSLVIRENIGIVSFIYGSLKNTLSYDEFATTLAMFGLDVKQGFWGLSKDPKIIAKLSTKDNSVAENDGEVGDGFAEDLKENYCESPKKCSAKKDAICMSGC